MDKDLKLAKILNKPIEEEQVDDGKYVASKDLEPLKNPVKKVKSIFKDMLSGDWQKQFDACNSLRSISIHHKELLTNDNFLMQTFVQSLIKQVDSLRSTVAKNALLGFKDLISNLKVRMDGELDHVLMPVVRRAADTNVFLSKAATDVLVAAFNH